MKPTRATKAKASGRHTVSTAWRDRNGVRPEGERRDEIKDQRKHEIKREIGGEPREMQSRLAILQKLEASLVSSHRALLALDLAAIAQGTSDQWTLFKDLTFEIQQSQNAPDREPAQNLELLPELRRREWKVLNAARVQAALLKRAQLKLHVMANMLAGLERNYAAPAVCRNKLRTSLLAENRG